jgi:CBS domain-containing protein
MAVFKNRSVLSGMTVNEAMQRQIVQLPADTPVNRCIRHIIKFKANAVVVTQGSDDSAGVVSKTDLIGAYYAGLPTDTPLSDIMVGPPMFCRPENSLETAVDLMQTHGIHQLYVRSDQGEIVGMTAYSDIVGLLYRYCRSCIRSGRFTKDLKDKKIPRLFVKDVMTHEVTSCDAKAPITAVIEILSGQKLGALLITDSNSPACGTISKTDLILAYVRGVSAVGPARTVMNTPVGTCPSDTLLSDAIRQMLLFDVQRLFVIEAKQGPVTGVLSLSDATRFRSGTCKACGAGRILNRPG